MRSEGPAYSAGPSEPTAETAAPTRMHRSDVIKPLIALESANLEETPGEDVSRRSGEWSPLGGLRSKVSMHTSTLCRCLTVFLFLVSGLQPL